MAQPENKPGDKPANAEAFIIANTRLLTPPLVPEVKLHLAEESLPIWQKSEEELGAINVAPPYWAFAWAGGQALARYILDNPVTCSGKTVLDLGSGSGLSALAAAKSGARRVMAADIDPFANAACRLNAKSNGLTIETISNDLLADRYSAFDILLVGDLFYERLLAARVLDYIETVKAAGGSILIGDPQRSYFPQNRFTALIEYCVPVTRELEDAEIKRTVVWAA